MGSAGPTSLSCISVCSELRQGGGAPPDALIITDVLPDKTTLTKVKLSPLPLGEPTSGVAVLRLTVHTPDALAVGENDFDSEGLGWGL